LTGSGITTVRDPDTFDWEALETPFNPFREGVQDHGLEPDRLGDPAVSGHLLRGDRRLRGLEYLREHAGLSPKLFELRQACLAKSGITDESKKG